ncbi:MULTISPECIES: esterase family protein [unclassified Ruminococcus]|uniref:alpha/beta hydrolase n=1 Tax=unclassified Ruminococcus TaxID=2608920 RepID=UPI00210AB6AE|nr:MULTISPECIES: alpha/beta hydrolase-fold protein [unclassified Ruminococcus]MCQ4022889.1 hypothetical protein [Ruminococcus sp. zg-924]MCQ4115295.1 hypothetical protein [Ruminococcus sp. zg-921]
MVNAILTEAMLPYQGRGERKIWVYVPQHNDGDVLPVIYMTDGQNLFDNNATVYGCLDVIGAVENKVKCGITGAAIVGIDNGNIYRDSELTPDSIGTVLHTELLNEIFKPEGEGFDSFLINTVMPYVQSNFPVSCDKRFNAVCGCSSGGLQAFFEGMEHSDLFSAVGALSPAFLLYSRQDWERYLALKLTEESPYIYIYSGAVGEEEQMIFESVEMLYDLLIELNYPYDKLNEVVLTENEHNENAWREIFPDFLHTFLSRAFGE